MYVCMYIRIFIICMFVYAYVPVLLKQIFIFISLPDRNLYIFFFNFHLICFSDSEHCFFNRMEFFVAIGSYMVGFSIEGETDSNIEPFPDEINIVTNVEICYKK